MAIPVPIVPCDRCRTRRVGLSMAAIVDDPAMQNVQILCRGCRRLGGYEEGEREDPADAWKAGGR